MFKNMKIGNRISILISTLLVVGLAVLAVIVIVNLRGSMEQQAKDRFSELADSRANVVDTYFEGLKGYVAGFAGLSTVSDFLSDRADEAKGAAVVKELNDYFKTRNGMEGLFILGDDGICAAHTNPAVVGVPVIKTAQDLSDYKGYLAKGPWIKGIAPATATGELVAVCYSGTYDGSGNFKGYIGGGAYITSLTDRLKDMEVNGLEDAEVWLLNLNANNYVVVPESHADLLGAEIQGEMDIRIASEAKSIGRSTFNYKGETGKMIVAYKTIPSLNYVVVVTAPEKEAMAAANSTARIIILISVLILAIMAVTAVFIGSRIGKEIAGVGEVIKELGNLDLTKADKLNEYTGRGDEIGEIADAAITLTSAVSDSVKSLNERAAQLQSEAGLLSDNTKSTLQSLNQIDSAVHEIAEGATSQSLEMQNAAEAVSSIGVKVGNTVNSTEKLKESAELLKNSSGSAKEILGQLSKINDRTKASVNDIYQQTNETNSSAERISEATALISSIASQTNLLSLNASIEAARAGEAGRGFTVVAEEIGKLADQSSESAKQIENIISSLVESSKRAVSTMEEVRDIMEQQNEYITKTGEIFGDVDREIGNSLNGISEISANVKDLDEARKALSDSVSSLSEIAEGNAASAEETSASTTVVNTMMEEVSGIATRVSEVSQNIRKDVDAYVV